MKEENNNILISSKNTTLGCIYKVTCIENDYFMFGQTIGFKKRVKHYKTTLNPGNFKEYLNKVLSNKSSLKNKTGYESLRGKEIHQYDLNGKYLKSYGSVREAARVNNCLNVSIFNCVKKIEKGLNSKSNGYLWSHNKQECLPLFIDIKKTFNTKKVIQYDSNKVFIKLFDSMAQAVQEVGVDYSNLIKSAKSNFKLKSKEFYWSYFS